MAPRVPISHRLHRECGRTSFTPASTGRAEYRMPVAVERDRAAMDLEVALQGLEVGEGTLRRHEAQLHEPAGRIVDEDEQRARVGAILEPAMLAAVDLHQLAQGLAAQPGLMQAPALLAREP